jgi:basic membrane protein A
MTWLMVLLAFALVAAACGDDAGTTTTADSAETTTTADSAETTTTAGSAETTTTAASAEPFKIAIVAPSAQNDLAFTQSIVDAVNVIKDEMGNVEVQITDNSFIVEDAASAIRAYAEDGVDLVIAHGSQYGGSLELIAPDFPDTAFAWGTAENTFGLSNVFAYEAASDEGGYVMGVMAAALSESGTIGIVGPVEVGDAKLYVDGFKAGVLAQNPDANPLVNYTDSFSDVALASEAAQAFAANGADVMSGTAQMVVGAVTVASDANILWFGTQANQTSLAPDIVVASQVYHWEVVLRDIVSKIQAGTPGGEQFKIDLANGGEVIEYNDAFALPDDVKQLGEDTIAGIIDGSIKTGS